MRCCCRHGPVSLGGLCAKQKTSLGIADEVVLQVLLVERRQRAKVSDEVRPRRHVPWSASSSGPLDRPC